MMLGILKVQQGKCPYTFYIHIYCQDPSFATESFIALGSEFTASKVKNYSPNYIETPYFQVVGRKEKGLILSFTQVSYIYTRVAEVYSFTFMLTIQLPLLFE